MVDIDWSAGSEGIRQNVHWTEDGMTLSVILTNEGVIMDLVDSFGDVVATEHATYEEIVDGMKEA